MPVGAQHAFASGAELLHRRLAASVALSTRNSTRRYPHSKARVQHHVFSARLKPVPRRLRAVIGAADLERYAARSSIGEMTARHAGELVAVE
jgi:hypothetical protein